MRTHIDDAVDTRSIGLYFCSVLLQIVSSITLSDFATFMAGTAAFTTVTYNVIRMYKEIKRNEKNNTENK
jgi:uncharacterized membrane protein YebE (DUF533 family)